VKRKRDIIVGSCVYTLAAVACTLALLNLFAVCARTLVSVNTAIESNRATKKYILKLFLSDS